MIKQESKYLNRLILLLIAIIGFAHTFEDAWSLKQCIGCSSPWIVALLFPGLLYGFLLLVAGLGRYFLRKKGKKTTIFLLSIWILVILLLVLTNKTDKHISEYESGYQKIVRNENNLSLQDFDGDVEEFIESYLEGKENAEMKYPRLQEKYFCGYEEFDREEKENQIISYGWQLCESYYLQDQEIICPVDSEIEKACFGNGECSACIINSIKPTVERGSGGSFPMKFIIEDGKVILERMPEDGESDISGRSGYRNSIKQNFSSKAFKKFKNYELSENLKNKLEQKKQEKIGLLEPISGTVKKDYSNLPDNHIQKFVSVGMPFSKADYEPTDLVNLDQYEHISAQSKHQLCQEAANALNNLANAFYQKFGKSIVVVSAYRSYDYQKNSISSSCKASGFCAKEGESEHQLGLAIDLREASNEQKFLSKYKDYYEWLKKNAHLYGFHQSYQKGKEIDGYAIEPWHWRYMGVELATYLSETGKSFSELALSKEVAG